jgi:molybdopterin-guanine dinucleotide biosynthesis protein A
MSGEFDLSNVTLAVLAGGQGSRMGMPKALLKIGDKPILEHLLDRFAWPGPTMLVTSAGREHPPGWERFDQEACDEVENEGPLRGVLTALGNCVIDPLVVVTVDMPMLTIDQLKFLLYRLNENPDLHGVMLRRPDRERAIEPFPFACVDSAAKEIAQRLQEHRRSVHALAESERFAVETAPTDWPAAVWTNLNTPDDLNDLKSLKPG